MSNLTEILFNIKYPIIFLFIFLTILSFFWKYIFSTLNLNEYHNIQRVHKHEVSRLGGLFIYIFLLSINIFGFIESKVLFNITISAVPFFIISLKEDLFHNTSPTLRLFTMIISCLIFFNINQFIFPFIDFPFLGKLISFYPISLLFFTFSLLVLMNGMNLIDGMNGLFGFTAIFQLCCICILANIFNDIEIIKISLIFLIPLLIFQFFNFPFGRVFIGDFGAYFYGFVIGILILIFFGRQQNIPSWLAVLILFYPCFELLFSYIRKIIKKQSPLMADDKHLHSLLYKKLSKNKIFKNSANFITTILLSFFWIIPPIAALLLHSFLTIIIFILFLSLIYILFYLVLIKDSKN